MKPTSIIFLCLAVLLAVGGIVTCYIASGMARDAGVELFKAAESAAGDDVTKNALDEEGLNKISLILKNADVNIYGGAAESCVDIVNYGVNTYSYSESAGILTVDESVGFLSLFNFSDSSVSFGGLRQYLNWHNSNKGRRRVDIYLTDSYSVKQLEVKVENGDVTVKNAKNRADYSFTISNGNLLFEKNASNSAVSADIGKGSATFRDSNIFSLNMAVKQGDFKFYVYNYAFQTYNIKADDGLIYLNGEDKGATLNASTPMAFINITAELKKGDVYIGMSDPSAPADETTAVTDAESTAETSEVTTHIAA